MIRAAWVGLSAALLAASAVHADAVRTVPLVKMFPYLEHYYRLAPTERERFNLEYRFRKPSPSVTAFMVQGARRVPVRTDARNIVQDLPDPVMLQSGVLETSATKDQKFSIGLSPQPVLTLSTSMPAAESAEAVAEISAVIRRFAGVLGFAAPRFNGVRFDGVRSGEAVFADGRRVPLPVVEGKPVYRPNTPAMRGAVRLAFPNAPTDVDFTD